METHPPPGPVDPWDDPLVSKPAERGTPPAALVDAIFSENVEQCRQLLDTYPDLINAPLKHQADARATRHDSAWGVTGEPSYQNVTPVVFAALAPRFREQRVEARVMSPSGLAIIALLIERGAALETNFMAQMSRHYWSQHLLIEVVRDYDSPEAVSLLSQIGADIHTRRVDDNHRTLLQAAAGRGALGVVRRLLDNGVPMNYPSPQEDWEVINGTPLHQAAANARHEAVQLLLSRGALSDLDAKDLNDHTPLIYAARGLRNAPGRFPSPDPDREETIRILVDAGADVTTSDGVHSLFRDSPLGHVSRWGSGDIIRYLVRRGSDVHQQRSYPEDEASVFPARRVGGDKVTPLHGAAHNWNEDGVKALLELGADPHALDGHGRLPLHWAAIGQADWNSEANTSGRDLAPTQEASHTDVGTGHANPILLARLAALESTISHLLANPHGTASINRQDVLGRTPLHYAASMNLVRAAALLVEHGADPSLADTQGRTALHHLADPLPQRFTRQPTRTTDVEDATARLGTALAVHAGIVNRADETGSAALHLAAASAADEAVVALLLRLGADPDLRDGAGATPLHLVARRPGWVSLGTYAESEYADWAGRAGRVRALLVDAGADEGVRDAAGRTAGEIEEAGWEEVRRGREKYLEYLASPRTPYAGFDRNGFGRGRPRRGFERRLPGAAGAGHGRGG